MKRVLQVLGFVVLIVVGLASALLLNAHRTIRAIDPPLPTPESFALARAGDELPVSLRVIVTSRQAMPRSTVLEPSLDPDPERPYVMTHPSFAIGWADGRLLLVDAGMRAEAAMSFGRPMEWGYDAEPLQVLPDVALTLGDDAGRVSGVVFTHLHVDHVDGIVALCEAAEREIAVFQGPIQSEQGNYTTRGPRQLIAGSGCARPTALGDDALAELPGFPGVRVLAAAGHTPGSQMVVVDLAPDAAGAGPRKFVFTGDVVNHAAAVEHNLPKPHLYSRFVVPESTERLERLRLLLGELSTRLGTTVVVSHDEASIEASGIPAWP